MEDYGLANVLAKMAVDMTMKAVNIEMPECKFCHSKNVVRNGKRNGVQYYLCREKACGRGFVYNKALPRMRYPIDIVADAVYDYYAGVSLNKITNGIRDKIGTKPSDSAIYGWVERLTKTGLAEAKKHIPHTSDTFQADETVIRLKDKRNKYWLINVIDTDTRFLLASILSDRRGMADIKQALETAKGRAGKSPKYILTDG
jgi:transposase-like protein